MPISGLSIKAKQPAITSSYFGNHSIRNRDWRLIVYEDGAKELYDHRNDPNEFRNLADDSSPKATLDELVKWLPKQAGERADAARRLGKAGPFWPGTTPNP